MMMFIAMLCAAGAAALLTGPSSPARMTVVFADLNVVVEPPQHRLLRQVRRRWSGVGARARRRRRAIAAAAALAAELKAGQPIRAAVGSTLGDLAPHACAAARWGGDVAAALHRDADQLHLPLWRSVAALWRVAESSGAGLAVALDRLVVTARAAEEVRVQLEAHLAAPRATARLLAMLPLIGILLGLSLGGDPLGWLLTDSTGRLFALGGIVLTVLGLLWVHRIARHVERLL
jgi:tight adherence protein B